MDLKAKTQLSSKCRMQIRSKQVWSSHCNWISAFSKTSWSRSDRLNAKISNELRDRLGEKESLLFECQWVSTSPKVQTRARAEEFSGSSFSSEVFFHHEWKNERLVRSWKIEASEKPPLRLFGGSSPVASITKFTTSYRSKVVSVEGNFITQATGLKQTCHNVMFSLMPMLVVAQSHSSVS